MGHFEEGNEDDSDSVDEDHFDEFEDDEDMVNIPLINNLNSNFQQLKREILYLDDQY